MRIIAGIIGMLLLLPAFSPALTVSTEPIPFNAKAEGREAWSRIYAVSLIYLNVDYTVTYTETSFS